MPSLFVIQGYDQGKRFEIDEPSITLGREAANSVQLHDTEVSREHAEIRIDELEGYRLRDLGSSNGTFVNSRRVREHLLKSGDRVQVGSTLMIFTGSETGDVNDVLDDVDIISSRSTEDSRIVKSLRQPDVDP